MLVKAVGLSAFPGDSGDRSADSRTLLGVTTDADWTRWERSVAASVVRGRLATLLCALIAVAVVAMGIYFTAQGGGGVDRTKLDCTGPIAQQPSGCFR